jgi:hypothetical protein
LKPLAEPDKVQLEIAIVLRSGLAGDLETPDRDGSGATRIEADLSIEI